ncbi:MAG: cupin domain-containing protein [Thermoplasmatota archaeon]
MIKKVNIDEKLEAIDEPWNPILIGNVDDYAVKLVKMKGEFEWHEHADEDEMFLVLSGKLIIKTDDDDIEMEEGELTVIPSGTRHKPMAREETEVMLFERESISRKGD